MVSSIKRSAHHLCMDVQDFSVCQMMVFMHLHLLDVDAS